MEIAKHILIDSILFIFNAIYSLLERMLYTDIVSVIQRKFNIIIRLISSEI